MKVYRLAARHDLPVLLHSNLTSLREETPIYLGELSPPHLRGTLGVLFQLCAVTALLAAQSALAKKANPGKPGAQKAKIDVPKPVTNLDLNGRRLVAVGDIHGDFAQAMKALELSKCMDSEGKWIGGTTVLVQVGDILDRGDNELAIMRKFQKLAREAKEAGYPIALYLDSVEHKYVEEFSTSNFIAISKDGNYVTPASESILQSVTNMSLRQIARDLGVAQQAFDTVRLVETLVRAELQLGREFQAQPLSDLSLEERGVGAQRLDHDILVLAQQLGELSFIAIDAARRGLQGVSPIRIVFTQGSTEGTGMPQGFLHVLVLSVVLNIQLIR